MSDPNTPPPGMRAEWQLFIVRRWVKEDQSASSPSVDMLAYNQQMDDVNRACRRANGITNFRNEDVDAEMEKVKQELETSNSSVPDFLRRLYNDNNNNEVVHQPKEQTPDKKLALRQLLRGVANADLTDDDSNQIELQPLLPIKLEPYDNDSNDTIPVAGPGPWKGDGAGIGFTTAPRPVKINRRGKTAETCRILEKLYNPQPNDVNADQDSGLLQIKTEPADINMEPIEPETQTQTKVNKRECPPPRSRSTRAKKQKAFSVWSVSLSDSDTPKPKPKPRPVKQTSFPCTSPGCNKIYTCKNGLKYHRQHHHLTPEEQIQRIVKLSDPPHHCEFPNCTRAYHNKSGLNYHTKNFHEREREPEKMKVVVVKKEKESQPKMANAMTMSPLDKIKAEKAAAAIVNEEQWKMEVDVNVGDLFM